MAEEHIEKKFQLKHLPSLFVKTFNAWNSDDPWRLSAVVAYYAVLSLPGLIVILINVVGSIWGQEIVQGQLTRQIASVLGADSADIIKSM
ncbi:MAG: ribonuclease BN, partial [Gelidibacter sp.]